MIVVDTNIISYFYLSGDKSEQVDRLLLKDSDWKVPVLWRSEFRSVLSQYLRKEFLDMGEILQISDEAETLLGNKEFQVSSIDVMKLVANSNCSSYDCEFVALALHLNVPLLTSDKKVLRTFPDIAQSLKMFLSA